jgi:hypothetical protein
MLSRDARNPASLARAEFGIELGHELAELVPAKSRAGHFNEISIIGPVHVVGHPKVEIATCPQPRSQVRAVTSASEY